MSSTLTSDTVRIGTNIAVSSATALKIATGTVGFTMNQGPTTGSFPGDNRFSTAGFSAAPRVYLQVSSSQANANTMVLVVTAISSTGFTFSATQTATTAGQTSQSLSWLAIGV